MPYTFRKKIQVWNYSLSESGEMDWQKKDTTAQVGTPDEYYFWRVMDVDGYKQFFISPEQWMDYSGHNGEGLECIVSAWYERYNKLSQEPSQ